MHYLSIFLKRFNKSCANFSRVLTKNAVLGNFEKILKIFDENSLEKWNFLFFRKFVTKNTAFRNNTIFLQQFFRFRRGGIPPFPPGYALGLKGEEEG